MAIEVKSKLDVSKIKEEILKKQRDNFDIALNDAATEIVIRTKAGKDARGGTFQGLSKGYKALKQKYTGRSKPDMIGFQYTNKKGRRVGSTQPGSMLAAITSTVTQAGNKLIGRIFFSSAKEAAKARGNNLLRRFFELSADQIRTIKNRLQGE